MNRLKEHYKSLFIIFQIKVMTVNAVGDSVLHNSNSAWLKKCSIKTRRLKIISRQPLSISAKSITSEAYRFVQSICALSKEANQSLITEISRLIRETTRSTLLCGEHPTASFKSTWASTELGAKTFLCIQKLCCWNRVIRCTKKQATSF